MPQVLELPDTFPALYGDIILIPADTILWRGYDKKYSSVSSRPSYYGSYNAAKSYSTLNNRELGAFRSRKDIKLLDIRFMKVILSRLFQNNTANINDIGPIIISFGLSSLAHQIKLMKIRYRDAVDNPGLDALEKFYDKDSLIEQSGVRVGETFNDAYTMAFLQELFMGFVDGFISPRFRSPYHIEKKGEINAEIILFNPLKSDIEQINITDDIKLYKSINIKQLIAMRYHTMVTLDNKQMYAEFYMKGGNLQSTLHPLDECEILMNNKNKEINKLYNSGITNGKKWRNKCGGFSIYIPPNPSIPVSPFINI
jgi:hypothetical protein